MRKRLQMAVMAPTLKKRKAEKDPFSIRYLLTLLI